MKMASVIPVTSKRYRGAEVFPLGDTSSVTAWKRTPNHVTFQVGGSGGMVVANQNYHPGWAASVGEVVAWKGLVGVQLPPGEHQVRLSFRPRLFFAGASISVAGLVALGIRGRRSRDFAR